MTRHPSLRGLYAITDPALIPPERLTDAVAAVIQGGAALIQYRDKESNWQRRLEQARALVTLCRTANVPLVVNDDIDLALQSGADGVHLGRDDPAMEEARALLGETALIGVSCYNQLSRAIEAERAGASYVAFGRFFVSPTKPQAVQASLALLREARQRIHIPIAAIGGITPENGLRLVQAGADLLAVISGVFQAADIRAAAARYARLFDPLD